MRHYLDILNEAEAASTRLRWIDGQDGTYRFSRSTDGRYSIAIYRDDANLALRLASGLSDSLGNFPDADAAKAAAQRHADGETIDPPSTPQNPARQAGSVGSTALQRSIAARIGATSFHKALEPGWGDEMIYTPDGYIFDTPSGKVFLDAMVVTNAPSVLGRDRPVNQVWLSEISVERRGNGLGGAVMKAIRKFCIETGRDMRVLKVTNQAFFDRFDWLIRDDRHGDSYRSEFGAR